MISIIIVNYNSGELLRNCVASIQKHLYQPCEIIIYDNHSDDGSLELLQSMNGDHGRIRIVRGEQNLGFARANNRAVEYAKGFFYHFLNPDIVINPSLNADYEEILQTGKKAIFVNPLADETGKVLKNHHLVPRVNNIIRRMLGSRRVAYWNLGASVIIHRDAFKAMGGWPEEYFMYAEDLDFFYTAFRKSIPVEYLKTPLIHIGKGVTHKIWSERERAAIIEQSFRKFYGKYHAGWEYLIIRPVQLFYILFNETGSFLLYFQTFVKTLFKNRS